jgi:uncharacterized protein (DUF111 family)
MIYNLKQASEPLVHKSKTIYHQKVDVKKIVLRVQLMVRLLTYQDEYEDRRDITRRTKKTPKNYFPAMDDIIN